jgi:hypothetical protein
MAWVPVSMLLFAALLLASAQATSVTLVPTPTTPIKLCFVFGA